MKLKKISENEFNDFPNSNKLICNAEYPKNFATLTLDDNSVSIGLCWESEIVQPQIINNDESLLLWFGIDQQLFGIRKNNLKIIVAQNLNSNLLELKKIKDLILVRCEMEIICFNTQGYLIHLESLPEISESFTVQENKILINLIDGNHLNLPSFLMR